MSMRIRGDIGELAVAEYLTQKGFKIAQRNYSCRFGEIDIIAEDKEYIVFAEVKARGQNAIASPCEFVTKKKQKNIVTTALFFLSSKKSKLQPRFDVFEVILDNNLPPEVISINHIENAFLGGK